MSKFAGVQIRCDTGYGPNALNTQNRLTFLNKHLILFKSLIESFDGGCVKIFDGRAFSLFETVPSCRAFSHSVIVLQLITLPTLFYLV